MLRKFFGLCLLALLVACGGPPPICSPGAPPPCPQPTPTPTPPPGPPMGLKVLGKRLVLLSGHDPRILGTIIGCHLEGVSGWPLICVESLDEIKSAGLNWTHIRTGPFTAEAEAPEFAFYQKDPASGKYDLTKISAAFQGLLRARGLAAKSRLIYFQVDIPGDRWPVQHFFSPWMASNNVQGEEHGGLDIFTRAPDPVHEAAIRAVVASVCDLDNVMFSTGNEAFKSDSDAWTRRVVELIRECPTPHVVGVNSEFHPLGDYEILHQSSSPPGGVRPQEVNEFGDDISPEVVISEALKADANGTYFHYWRGSHSSAEWIATMKTLGEIRAGHPPTPQCLPPPGASGWTGVCKVRADLPGTAPLCSTLGLTDQKAAALRAAESKANADRPDLFSSGCLLDNSDAGYIAGLAAVGKAARDLGECGGQKDDAVFLRRNDGDWQEEHAIARGSGCFTQPENAFKYIYRHGAPVPPPVVACPVEPQDVVEWRYNLKPHPPASQQLSLTPFICGPVPRAALANCGTQCCQLSPAPEGGDVNAACLEKLYGIPDWQVDGTADLILPDPNQPFNVKVRLGEGYLLAPGTKGGPANRTWWIHATSPACDVAPDGFCSWLRRP